MPNWNDFVQQPKPFNPGDLGAHNQGIYQTGNPADNPAGIPYYLQQALQQGNPEAMNYPGVNQDALTKMLAGSNTAAPSLSSGSYRDNRYQSGIATPGGPPEGTPMGPSGVGDPSGLPTAPWGQSPGAATAAAGGMPSNPYLTADNYRTGVNGGTIPPGTLNRPVIETYGDVRSDGSYGNQNATAPQLPSDLMAALRQLMQNSLDQGRQGQEAYTGITNDIRSFLDFNRQAATDSMGRQDELINSLMGRINPAIDQSLALMNQREGLSPEAMAALRGQAMEGSATQYGQNVEALKSELARRGAAGGGDMPGSAGDIARGYGPLMASRDQQRSQGLRDAILADEQRKFESLGLNRQTAMQGLNTAAGLTGTLGQVYDPSKFLNASQASMGQLAGIVGARNDSATNALNQAGSLAQMLAGNQLSAAQLAENARQADQSNTTANRRIDADTLPTSTAQLLKNALIGAGFSGLTGALTGGDSGGGLINTAAGLIGKIFGKDGPSTDEQMKGLADIVRSGALAGIDIGSLSKDLGTVGGLPELAAELGGTAGAVGAAAAAPAAAVPLTGYAGGGLVTSHGALIGMMTNPITIGIAAAAIGAIAWTKSQAHHEANTFVQKFQNPFDSKVGQINDEFFRLAQSGQLDKQSATTARNLIATAINKYEEDRLKFAKEGGDEKKVAEQAKATADQWYGKDYKPYFDRLDSVIAGLA